MYVKEERKMEKQSIVNRRIKCMIMCERVCGGGIPLAQTTL